MAKMKRSQIAAQQIEYYRKAVEDGSIPDDLNPIALLQSVSTNILLKIAKNELDMALFAQYELQVRGLDREGKWVGFPKAEAIWNTEQHAPVKRQIKKRSF